MRNSDNKKAEKFDNAFNVLGDFTKKELKEFFLDERAQQYFKGIVQLVGDDNEEQMSQEPIDNEPVKEEEAGATTSPYKPELCGYDLIVNSIKKINAESLYFLKEFYNEQKYPQLNIMQINKMVNDCEKPFKLLWFPKCHPIVSNKENIEKVIEQFDKYGIRISFIQIWD